MSLAKTARVTENRMERALRIYNGGLVRTMGAGTFVVKSEAGNAYYIVNSHGCTCRDSVERQMICKPRAHVRCRNPIPHHIREITRYVIKRARLEIRFVSKGQKRDTRTNTRTENADAFVSF